MSTDPTPGEVGLSEAEREVLLSVSTDQDAVAAVERILAARTAAGRTQMLNVCLLSEERRARAEAAEAREAELRATAERATECIDKAGKRLARVLADQRVGHHGSDPVFLAVHDAQNALARGRAALTTPPTTEGA